MSSSSYQVSIGCSFKFPVKVGVEESIVNAPWITDHGSVFTRVLSSQSNLTGNLNEHPIDIFSEFLHQTNRQIIKMLI
jgi:hypothetical protein